jgi:hypothetical protein
MKCVNREPSCTAFYNRLTEDSDARGGRLRSKSLLLGPVLVLPMTLL